MAAGMTPPLGICVTTIRGGSRFTQAEREVGKAAGVLGLSFITEGAIPFAAKNPLRVIPSMVVGSAVAGAISMYSRCGLRAPHGAVFVLAVPNAVTPPRLVRPRHCRRHVGHQCGAADRQAAAGHAEVG